MLDIKSLNEPQSQAVTTTDGPVLVLAGAGSGKTKALTYRIAYLLDAGLAGPSNILAMTFTNKAAAEMKERINVLLKQSAVEVTGLPWMGTFHSICVKILKINGELIGISRNFTIYDSSDSVTAIKDAMRKLNISTKEFNPKAIKNYISSAKNELVNSVTYESFAQGYFQTVVAEVYPEYQKILRKNNALDFDDLIMYTVNLFEQNKSMLQKYQDQFKYIMVDEYQDTNHAQYVLVNMLADGHKNICVVGDDDQSIYAFRGATIKNILNFEKDYPDAQIIKLEQNYRSTKKILEASYQVISKNRGRKDKKLWTQNNEGENIQIYEAGDETSEANWVVKQIEELQKSKVPLNDIAILYRTNAQSRNLEEAFLRSNVPYIIVGGVKFYDRKEIKDILSYLRVIHNPKDNTSFERIVNTPRRGIGSRTFDSLLEKANSEDLSVLEYLTKYKKDLANTKLSDLADLMIYLHKASSELDAVEFIENVLDKSGYIAMLEDGTLENESRIENIRELVSLASRFANEEGGLEMFLEEVALLEDIESKQNENTDQDRVTLMTIHAAKGLEFKYIFVIGMEENLFPHSNSIMDEKELEEERRLAYVAITRAKEKLFLTHATSRIYFGASQSNAVSRFVTDIDSRITDYKRERGSFSSDFFTTSAPKSKSNSFKKVSLFIGDKVRHNYFGVGKVVFIDDEIIEIDFGSLHGVKELMLEYANLEKV